MQLSCLNPVTWKIGLGRTFIEGEKKIKKGAASASSPEHPVWVKDRPDPIGITALSFQFPFVIVHPETPASCNHNSCRGLRPCDAYFKEL